MINSIPIKQNPSSSQQPLGGSCPAECNLEERMDMENGGSGGDVNGSAEPPQTHSRTVQALRKYLQRKLSSEDSSSERESQSPSQEINMGTTTTDLFPPRSFETMESGDGPKSTLTCSIVYSSNSSPGKHNYFPFHKQRSLDDYAHYSSATTTNSFFASIPTTSTQPTTIIPPPPPPPDHRYLRTDLCVPILLSRCTFCDQSFELDDDLRAHMREKHWNYFFDNHHHFTSTMAMSQASFQETAMTCEVLDLSMRRRQQQQEEEEDGPASVSLTNMNLDVTGSLPNLYVMSSMDFSGGRKKIVKCATCGKGFSTKWNWKQHQKIHLRENLQANFQ